MKLTAMYQGDEAFSKFLLKHEVPVEVYEIRAMLLGWFWCEEQSDIEYIIDEILYRGTEFEYKFSKTEDEEIFQSNIKGLWNSYLSYIGSASRIPTFLDVPAFFENDDEILNFLIKKENEISQFLASIDESGTGEIISQCPHLMIVFDHLDSYEDAFEDIGLFGKDFSSDELHELLKYVREFNQKLWPDLYKMIDQIFDQITNGNLQLLYPSKAKKEYQKMRLEIIQELNK